MNPTSENKAFDVNHSINLKGKLMDFKSPRVMGILNLTPDSFYDGGKYSKLKEVLTQVEKMLSEGADIIDIGAQSTKPGSQEITLKEEKKRLIPVLKEIRKNFSELPISIDTYKAEIARETLDIGANIINDISAGSLDKEMIPLIAEYQVPYIIMHMQGSPKNMQSNPSYKNVVTEVFSYLHDKVKLLNKKGINDIIVDPGFGFGKGMEHNYKLLKNLSYFNELSVPILAGISRKSMIYKLLETTSDLSLNGTTTANTIALLQGAKILRVHDVKEAKEAIKIVDFLQKH